MGEAIRRHPGGRTWGRDDPARPRGQNGWVAYTTDPGRHDLAWVVRWHPDHGRSVVLFRDDEAVTAYTDYTDGPLLFRSGGYWWDGTTWYRPSRVIDWAGEDYFRTAVPGAATLTAAGVLAAGAADPARGTVLAVAAIDPDVPYEGRWNDDLALWAERRSGLDLDRCVAGLTAPELAAENLIGAPDLAEITGIAPSTLRSYIARSEADVPLPQAVSAAAPCGPAPLPRNGPSSASATTVPSTLRSQPPAPTETSFPPDRPSSPPLSPAPTSPACGTTSPSAAGGRCAGEAGTASARWPTRSPTRRPATWSEPSSRSTPYTPRSSTP